MKVHALAAGAAAWLLAAPAFADCMQQIEEIDRAVVSAETGASMEPSGMPATKHQEEVLSGKKTEGEVTAPGSVGQPQATTPHERDVTGLSDGKGQEASQLVDEARRLAEAGDEQACMEKVAEAKQAIGME